MCSWLSCCSGADVRPPREAFMRWSSVSFEECECSLCCVYNFLSSILVVCYSSRSTAKAYTNIQKCANAEWYKFRGVWIVFVVHSFLCEWIAVISFLVVDVCGVEGKWLLRVVKHVQLLKMVCVCVLPLCMVKVEICCVGCRLASLYSIPSQSGNVDNSTIVECIAWTISPIFGGVLTYSTTSMENRRGTSITLQAPSKLQHDSYGNRALVRSNKRQ